MHVVLLTKLPSMDLRDALPNITAFHIVLFLTISLREVKYGEYSHSRI